MEWREHSPTFTLPYGRTKDFSPPVEAGINLQTSEGWRAWYAPGMQGTGD